jgi:uncharacterized alkaline shock family protein YloU
MTASPDLAVSRSVVRDVVRLAAAESPGVARVGRRSWWDRIRRRPAIDARIEKDGRVAVTVHIVARPDVSLPTIAEGVRTAVDTAIGRVLGLTAGSVTVVVDGVGG